MVKCRKNRWTAEEEEALVAGITKHGTGKWMDIKEDPEFSEELVDRTNVDLKDKWRNMKNKEKSVTQNHKSASISYVNVKNESYTNSSSDYMSNESRCDEIVLEAVASISDEYGSDVNRILSEIQEQYEIPQNFRKVLSESLEVLVSQGKLEKVQNRYKISVVKSKLFEVAATRIAEANNKEIIASEAIKEK